MTSFQTFPAPAIRSLAALALAGALAFATPTGSLAAGANAGKPRASTGGVGHLTGTAGQLQATINPEGKETSYFFQYGPTIAYGSKTTPVTVGSGTSNVKVGQSVTGLTTGFHYRVVAVSSAGETLGKDKVVATSKKKLSFAFPKIKPSERVTGYGGTYTLSGTLTGTGNANRPVQLETQPYPYSGAFTAAPAVLTSAAGAFSFRIPGMRQNTKVRVVVPGPRPTTSEVLTIGVAVRVTVHVRSIAHVGLARVYGTVSPAASGQAFVQVLKPAKETSKREATGPKAQSVGATKLKRSGGALSRFSAVVPIHATGNYRVYVRVTQGPLVSGYSPDVKIRALGPAKRGGKTKK
jgi:hypothetical protein